jgi:putative Mn2+ efflux pump MntP
MSFLYIGLGIFFLVAEHILNFSSFQQFGVGIILIIYGLFRFYNALKKKRERELEQNEEEEQ